MYVEKITEDEAFVSEFMRLCVLICDTIKWQVLHTHPGGIFTYCVFDLYLIANCMILILNGSVQEPKTLIVLYLLNCTPG